MEDEQLLDRLREIDEFEKKYKRNVEDLKWLLDEILGYLEKNAETSTFLKGNERRAAECLLFSISAITMGTDFATMFGRMFAKDAHNIKKKNPTLETLLDFALENKRLRQKLENLQGSTQ